MRTIPRSKGATVVKILIVFTQDLLVEGTFAKMSQIL